MNTSSRRYDIPTRSRISATRVVVYGVMPVLMACLLAHLFSYLAQASNKEKPAPTQGASK